MRKVFCIMSADLRTEINFEGSNENVFNMLKVLQKFMKSNQDIYYSYSKKTLLKCSSFGGDELL